MNVYIILKVSQILELRRRFLTCQDDRSLEIEFDLKKQEIELKEIGAAVMPETRQRKPF